MPPIGRTTLGGWPTLPLRAGPSGKLKHETPIWFLCRPVSYSRARLGTDGAKPRPLGSTPGQDRTGDLQRVRLTSEPLDHRCLLVLKNIGSTLITACSVPAWSNGEGASIRNLCRYFVNTQSGGDVGSIPTAGIMFPERCEMQHPLIGGAAENTMLLPHL